MQPADPADGFVVDPWSARMSPAGRSPMVHDMHSHTFALVLGHQRVDEFLRDAAAHRLAKEARPSVVADPVARRGALSRLRTAFSR